MHARRASARGARAPRVEQRCAFDAERSTLRVRRCAFDAERSTLARHVTYDVIAGIEGKPGREHIAPV